MSKTPRSDANSFVAAYKGGPIKVVTIITSEKLETELAEAKELNVKLVEALEKIQYHTTQTYYREEQSYVRAANKIAKAALEAAKGTK